MSKYNPMYLNVFIGKKIADKHADVRKRQRF